MRMVSTVKVKMASKIDILANTEDLKRRWTLAAGVENAAGHKNMLQLIQLRWIAVVGQITTIAIVIAGFGIQLPLPHMLKVLACLVAFNIASHLRWHERRVASNGELFLALLVDVGILTAQLYLSGGINNPFAFLFLLQVILSAVLLETWSTWTIVAVTSVCLAGLSLFFEPLALPPDHGSGLSSLYVEGLLICFVLNAALLVFFVTRIGRNLRAGDAQLADLRQRAAEEDHIVRMGLLASGAAHELGTPLATITLVAKEMEKALGSDPKYGEDVKLLRSQSERCREILKRLTSLSSEGEAHLSRLPLTSLVEEVTAPHRDFGISIKLRPGERIGPEPVGRRNPGVIYGLGNLVENAVDFARKNVTVRWSWDEAAVTFSIIDDGPGFPPEIIDRIGEPYMSTRQGTEAGGGLGLGLFIAKTLLERSGATLDFRNSSGLGEGAVVQISWPRSVFLNPETAPATMFDTA